MAVRFKSVHINTGAITHFTARLVLNCNRAQSNDIADLPFIIQSYQFHGNCNLSSCDISNPHNISMHKIDSNQTKYQHRRQQYIQIIMSPVSAVSCLWFYPYLSSWLRCHWGAHKAFQQPPNISNLMSWVRKISFCQHTKMHQRRNYMKNKLSYVLFILQ